MTEAQRHQILLDMLAQLGFVTVENVYPAATALDANESAPGTEPR